MALILITHSSRASPKAKACQCSSGSSKAQRKEVPTPGFETRTTWTANPTLQTGRSWDRAERLSRQGRAHSTSKICRSCTWSGCCQMDLLRRDQALGRRWRILFYKLLGAWCRATISKLACKSYNFTVTFLEAIIRSAIFSFSCKRPAGWSWEAISKIMYTNYDLAEAFPQIISLLKGSIIIISVWNTSEAS